MVSPIEAKIEIGESTQVKCLKVHTSSKWAESTQVLTPPVSAETSKSVTKHLIRVHVLPTVTACIYGIIYVLFGVLKCYGEVLRCSLEVDAILE